MSDALSDFYDSRFRSSTWHVKSARASGVRRASPSEAARWTKRRGGQRAQPHQGIAKRDAQAPCSMLVRVQLLNRLGDNESAATNRTTRTAPIHRVSFWGLPPDPCPFKATHRSCSSATKCDAPCAQARPVIERRSTPKSARWTGEVDTSQIGGEVDRRASRPWRGGQRRSGPSARQKRSAPKVFAQPHSPMRGLFNY